MVRSLFSVAGALLFGMTALMIQSGWSSARGSEPILALAGRWAGQGTMVPASGPSQTFKCVITYFPSRDGSSVRQNVRCKGGGQKFDAATNLQIAGLRVTGQWTDNVYSLTGTVTGVVTADGFDILLSGRYFEARMQVVSSACEQSVTVTPDSKSEMKELAALLKKC